MGNNEQHDAGRSACHPAADAGLIGLRSGTGASQSSTDSASAAYQAGSGESPPAKDEPARLGCRGGLDGALGTVAGGNFASLRAERKAVEDLRARGARAGCCLYELAGDGHLITRRSMVRELPDLLAVEELLRAMGVR